MTVTRTKMTLAAALAATLALSGCAKSEPARQASSDTSGPTQSQAPPPAPAGAPDSLGLALGALRGDSQQPAAAQASAEAFEAEVAAVPRVTIEELVADLNAGRAYVVDVRDDEQFDAAHVAGSVHIPLGDIASRASTLPKDKLIVLYCT